MKRKIILGIGLIIIGLFVMGIGLYGYYFPLKINIHPLVSVELLFIGAFVVRGGCKMIEDVLD